MYGVYIPLYVIMLLMKSSKKFRSNVHYSQKPYAVKHV